MCHLGLVVFLISTGISIWVFLAVFCPCSILPMSSHFLRIFIKLILKPYSRWGQSKMEQE